MRVIRRMRESKPDPKEYAVLVDRFLQAGLVTKGNKTAQ